MADTKFFSFPDNGGGGNDLAAMLAMNGGGMGGGMWNNPIWAIVFLSALNNGNLLGGNGRNSNINGNVDFVSSQLGNAIAGNANAISNLATQLNCTESQIQNGINNMLSGINNMSNNMNLSAQNIVNAVNSGNMNLANQLCQCCCEMREAVTRQGYEGQIRTLEQTNILQSGMGQIRQDIAMMGANDTLAICQQTNTLQTGATQNTQAILAELRQMQTQALQDKLDAARNENTRLSGEISQANQNGVIAGMISNAVNPLASSLAGIRAEVDAIKRCQPSTITLPNNSMTAVPTIWANAVADNIVDRISTALTAAGGTTTTTPTT